MATSAPRHKAKQLSQRKLVQPALPIFPVSTKETKAKSSQSATPIRVLTPPPPSNQTPGFRDPQQAAGADKGEPATHSPPELTNGIVDTGDEEVAPASESLHTHAGKMLTSYCQTAMKTPKS